MKLLLRVRGINQGKMTVHPPRGVHGEPAVPELRLRHNKDVEYLGWKSPCVRHPPELIRECANDVQKVGPTPAMFSNPQIMNYWDKAHLKMLQEIWPKIR